MLSDLYYYCADGFCGWHGEEPGQEGTGVLRLLVCPECGYDVDTIPPLMGEDDGQ
jgi:hypothetical protein